MKIAIKKRTHGIKEYYQDNILIGTFNPIIKNIYGKGYQLSNSYTRFRTLKEMKDYINE